MKMTYNPEQHKQLEELCRKWIDSLSRDNLNKDFGHQFFNLMPSISFPVMRFKKEFRLDGKYDFSIRLTNYLILPFSRIDVNAYDVIKRKSIEPKTYIVSYIVSSK